MACQISLKWNFNNKLSKNNVRDKVVKDDKIELIDYKRN